MNRTNDIRYLYDTNSGIELIFCDHSTISYPLHNHVSVFTFGIVLAGSILLNNGFGACSYHKDQTFALPPYRPHSITANDNYTLLSLCMHKDLLNCHECNIDTIKDDLTNLLTSVISADKITQQQITQLLDRIDYFADDTTSWGLQSDVPIIDDLKQRLELFPETKFSIEEMAHLAFISKYHFIRSFKQKVGLTPHQFQLQNRIRKAQRLLGKVDTITEVALTTGFCDQSHFIKQFEKHVGLTPTNYKTACRIHKPDSSG